MQLGGCQDEHHVFGRLLQRFEQRVERACREHMYLVDDIHALFKRCGSVDHLVADIADIVYAVVGGCVHFKHVGCRTRFDRAAGIADKARRAVYGLLAVDRLGKDLCAGGLTRSARSAKQICMRKPARPCLILQNRRDVLLTANVLKALRTPFSVKCLMHNYLHKKQHLAAKQDHTPQNRTSPLRDLRTSCSKQATSRHTEVTA